MDATIDRKGHPSAVTNPSPPRERPIRLLLTKSRMDAHDRGARDLARYLREAGMEVLFTRFGLPEEIGEAALQEGVDLIGVSSASGGHVLVARRLRVFLTEHGASELPVLFGGIIPKADHDSMRAAGVHAMFGPGSSLAAVADTIRALVAERSS